MVWSWILDGRQEAGETVVELLVEAPEGGSRLTITHSGDRDAETIERFKSEWPVKLGALAALLSGGHRDRTG